MSNNGLKFDDDKYTKVDLSLVPWRLLSMGWDKGNIIHGIAYGVHRKLNDRSKSSCREMIDQACMMIAIENLAVSLGYGEVKYGRDNWQQGFGGDWRRFLQATLRHCKAILDGKGDFDGEAVDGYPKGNSHRGAVLFSLMVGAAEEEK